MNKKEALVLIHKAMKDYDPFPLTLIDSKQNESVFDMLQMIVARYEEEK